jgi:hypothetical protein
MRGLDPRIRHWRTLSSIVIPAEAGIQLELVECSKLDPGLRRGDE